MTGLDLDFKPQIVKERMEPSLREIVKDYYERHPEYPQTHTGMIADQWIMQYRLHHVGDQK